MNAEIKNGNLIITIQMQALGANDPNAYDKSRIVQVPKMPAEGEKRLRAALALCGLPDDLRRMIEEYLILAEMKAWLDAQEITIAHLEALLEDRELDLRRLLRAANYELTHHSGLDTLACVAADVGVYEEEKQEEDDANRLQNKLETN
jgi:hypothetical protein